MRFNVRNALRLTSVVAPTHGHRYLRVWTETISSSWPIRRGHCCSQLAAVGLLSGSSPYRWKSVERRVPERPPERQTFWPASQLRELTRAVAAHLAFAAA